MINYNSSGDSMRALKEEVLLKAIRMSIASVSMEEDFCLQEVQQINPQNDFICKVLVLQKGGNKNGCENTKRN